MTEIKDTNCIVKAFETHHICILRDDQKYFFRATDVGEVLDIKNIYTSVQNFDDDERGLREVETLSGNQKVLYLTSQGVYRLLYNSKKPVAKKFRKWVGNILDDIIFNHSKELQKQLKEKEELIKKLQNKPETEGFLRKDGFIYLIHDKDKDGHYKIGLSYEPVKRLASLNVGSSTNSLEIVETFRTKDCVFAEKTIHSALQPHRIKNQKEWFYFPQAELLKYVKKTISNCIDFVESYVVNNVDDELSSASTKLKNTNAIYVSKEVQTELLIDLPNSFDSFNNETCLFQRFIRECCIIDEIQFVNIKYLVQQYKMWAKMHNITNYKEFDTYIRSKFEIKQMIDPTLQSNVLCVKGITLRREFTEFNFQKPFSDFEQFLVDKCVKRPTARINRTNLRIKYLEWKKQTTPNFTMTKLEEQQFHAFMNKHFFHDLFYDGKTSYLGWYGVAIAEESLIGSGALISNNKKRTIVQYETSSNKEVKRWDSQKVAANELGISPSTLTNWIRAKTSKNGMCYKFLSNS
jgi:prophage antirepressor-like protein